METEKTMNKKWIIIIAAIAAVVCIAVAAVILVTGNGAERKLTEQLDLAEGYLVMRFIPICYGIMFP